MWRSVELDRSLLLLSERLAAGFADAYPPGRGHRGGRPVRGPGRTGQRVPLPGRPGDRLLALAEQAVRARLATPPVPARRAPRPRLVATG